MSVAGFGFREAATADSLRSALHAALAQSDAPITLTALATAWDKAGAPAFVRFAADWGLPVLAIPADALRAQPAHTCARTRSSEWTSSPPEVQGRRVSVAD